MSHVDRSYERLEHVNPFPTVVVEPKPTAEDMLAMVEGQEVVWGDRAVARSGRGRRGLLVAAAVFVLALLVGSAIVLAGRGGNAPPVTDPPVTTTSTTLSPSTTEPTTVTTTSTTTTTIAPQVDPETLADIDRFVEVFNAGDVDAFMAFLAPDITREWFDEGVFSQTLDEVRTLYEIDAALNTEIAITDCELRAETVVCQTTRFSDLNRVLGNPPLADWDFRPVFEDGLLVYWAETRSNNGPFDTFYRFQIRDFMDWVRVNHPEVGELRPVVPLDWVIREGIAEEIAGLIDEWAASRGVVLDE